MAVLLVGEAAALVGVSPSTVRMWGTRYGLEASGRSTGGHRRYTEKDVERLRRMHQAVIAGMRPSEAAAAALSRRAAPRPKGRPGGPGGAVLAVSRAGPAAQGIARAASRLDTGAVEERVVAMLRDRGTLVTWNAVLLPVLVSCGERWARTGSGIEVEHALTQAVADAFVRYATGLPRAPSERPVLLAGGPGEDHVLPLHAVRAALAERAVPARLLGPRTPAPALAAAARRTGSAAVLVWASRSDPAAVRGVTEIAGAHRRLQVIVGGPGWTGGDVAAQHALNLTDAVERLGSAWHARRTENLHKLHPRESARR